MGRHAVLGRHAVWLHHAVIAGDDDARSLGQRLPFAVAHIIKGQVGQGTHKAVGDALQRLSGGGRINAGPARAGPVAEGIVRSLRHHALLRRSRPEAGHVDLLPHQYAVGVAELGIGRDQSVETDVMAAGDLPQAVALLYGIQDHFASSR